jgi:hypothetical protein
MTKPALMGCETVEGARTLLAARSTKKEGREDGR